MNISAQHISKLARWLVMAAACLAVSAHADDYTDVGQLLRSGKLVEALTKADAYLATNPRDPQMRFLKGVIQRDAGKQADAIATFTKLTEDYPELPEPYNNLAVLYAGQSQFDKARAALEMAIRTNPSYATAHENLGDVYAKLASQAYNKALQLDSANVGVPPKLALIRELFSPTAKGQRPAAALPASVPSTPALLTTPAVVAAVTAAVPAIAAAKPGSPATFVAVAPPVTVATPKLAPPATSSTNTLPPAAASPSAAPVAAPAMAAVPTPARSNAPTSAMGDSKDTTKDSAKEARDAELAVRAWAAAWSAKDMAAYLSAYGREFIPPANLPRRAWEEDRRARITSKASISVKLENLTVSVNGNKAVVKFRQDYKASGLAVSSRKTLDLVKTGSTWQIARESTGA